MHTYQFYRPLASEGPRRYEKQSQWDSGSNETLSLLGCKFGHSIIQIEVQPVLTDPFQHDTTVAPMMSALGVWDGKSPPYATAFFVELYSDPIK